MEAVQEQLVRSRAAYDEIAPAEAKAQAALGAAEQAEARAHVLANKVQDKESELHAAERAAAAGLSRRQRVEAEVKALERTKRGLSADVRHTLGVVMFRLPVVANPEPNLRFEWPHQVAALSAEKVSLEQELVDKRHSIALAEAQAATQAEEAGSAARMADEAQRGAAAKLQEVRSGGALLKWARTLLLTWTLCRHKVSLRPSWTRCAGAKPRRGSWRGSRTLCAQLWQT